jgi:hypothetical protein
LGKAIVPQSGKGRFHIGHLTDDTDLRSRFGFAPASLARISPPEQADGLLPLTRSHTTDRGDPERFEPVTPSAPPSWIRHVRVVSLDSAMPVRRDYRAVTEGRQAARYVHRQQLVPVLIRGVRRWPTVPRSQDVFASQSSRSVQTVATAITGEDGSRRSGLPWR